MYYDGIHDGVSGVARPGEAKLVVFSGGGSRTLAHEIGHMFGATDHYDQWGWPATNTDIGQTRSCLYGEEPSGSEVCDYCAAIIKTNASIFNHQ